MIRFDYNSIMKRHNVIVPFTLSEDNRLTTHRELKISLVRQILMHWDEQEHMIRMKEAREAGKPTFY